MSCASCNGSIPPDSRYCSWCGAEVTPAVTASALGTPAWREATPGWIAAHTAIGLFALWAAQVLLVKALVSVAGEDVRLLAADLVPTLTGAAGWILFVYLRASPAQRWLALAGVLLVGVGLGVALNLVAVT